MLSAGLTKRFCSMIFYANKVDEVIMIPSVRKADRIISKVKRIRE